MVIKKRQILWDWTNTAGPGNPGVPDKIEQVPFGKNSPVASFVNWNAWVPPELRDRAPFRPMVRVLESTTGNDWAMIQNSQSPIILFFNEPERAGISPEQAKDIWYNQILPLRRDKGKKLGSPAVASDDNGRNWIERFMSLVSNDPPDFLCLHYYSKNANEAIQYLESMHKKWPQHPVMVTEIACIDRDYQAVVNFTVKICNWMDNQNWIFEYGLFDFQRNPADGFVSPAAQLMHPDGNFTELGNMYVHQQPMTAPGQAGVFVNAFVAAEATGVDSAHVEPNKEAEEASEITEPTENVQTGEPASHEPSDEAFEVAEDGEEQTEFGVAAALSPDQQEALKIHNNKRGQKGVKPLAWDNKLARDAETYAKHLAQIGRLEHSSGDQRPNQGENLAA
ncbi:hypothetical protein AAE478_005778 [Parahypoxylon ruwenzoriense]